ncbi:MAG: hypothetical protein ACRC63_00775, partial [Metamycoplasmataceae bacterium]
LGMMISSATIIPLAFVTSYNIVLVKDNNLKDPNILTINTLNNKVKEMEDLDSKNILHNDLARDSLINNELKIIIDYELEPLENENAELLKTKLIKPNIESS